MNDVEMNDDTNMVYEGLANIEYLYIKCESAASYAAFTTDNPEDFHIELANELERIVNENKEWLPGFSLTEPIEYENVSYLEIAQLYAYADYRDVGM